MSYQGQNRLGSVVGGAVNTLKGNSGGFVGPDGGGNINVIGDGTTIDVVGTPGTNTLTISALGNVSIMFTADDANIATPVGGNLNVFGSTNINTQAPGSADIIQINLNNSILLPDTLNGNNGVIALGADLTADRFIHNFGTDNTFIGSAAGNFTLTTSRNNVALGSQVLGNLTTGNNNSSVGFTSLFGLDTGSGNSVLGATALDSINSGSFNTVLGLGSGTNYVGAESSNILISNNGVLGEDNTIRIGTQGNGVLEQDQTFIAGIYDTPYGATHQVVFIDDTGKLGSSLGNDGEIIIGSTAGSPEWGEITSLDGSITVTNGSNTIDLSTTGGTMFTVTTNDATPTALVTHAVGANSAVTMNATVAASRSDFSESLWGTVVFGVRRAGAGAIAVETPTSSFNDDSAGAPIITADVNGNNLRLMVTGVAASTWNWKATVTFVTQT